MTFVVIFVFVDPNSKDGAEKEHYFWVYTDFYKWSLLSQAGKLALLVNVFADSSFSRRYEVPFIALFDVFFALF